MLQLVSVYGYTLHFLAGGIYMFIYMMMIDSPEDQSKFEKIYSEYKGLMYYVAYKILNNKYDAEDAVHNAFIKIAENIHKIDEAVCQKTQNYVVTIVENKAIDTYRANKRKETVEYIDEMVGITVENHSLQGLAYCMAKLPPRYRQIILLKYYHGYNSKEISKQLDLTEANVIKLDQRAKKKIASNLQRGGHAMITDEMMVQAATELAEAVNNSLPAPNECTHRFSATFERKIKHLVRKTNHPVLYRTVQAVMCIILALCISFGSLLALSPEARAMVYGWIRQQYESFYEYFFDGEASSYENAQYSPQWIPQGYTLASSQEIIGGERYIYSNNEGGSFLFSYMNASESSKLYAEGVEYEQCDVSINGHLGEIYISHDSDDSSLLVWTDSNTGTLFYLNALLDKDSMIFFAENVVQKK